MSRRAQHRLALAGFVLLAVGLPVGGLGLAIWPQVSVYGQVISHGDRSHSLVALTFDDGPNAPATREIADALRRQDVKATFFLVGVNAERDPDTVQRLVADGHVIGNHSYRHQKRDAIFDYGYDEAERAQAAIFTASGVCPALFRPPNGFHTPWQLAAVSRLGLTTVAWDVQTYDWEQPAPERILERVIEQVEPGSIVLLHDGNDVARRADRSATLAALPGLIVELERRGYQLVTLDQLLDVPAYQDSCG